MKVLILGVGSRGDVQPYIALGVGLQNAGYEVTVGAPKTFDPFVTGYGLRFAPLNDEFLKLKDTSAGKAALEKGGGKGFALIKQVMPMLRAMLDDAWEAAQGMDAVIYHPKALAGPHLAEALKIPVIMSLPLSLYAPTGDFPLPLLPDLHIRALNRFTYSFLPLVTAPFMGMVNQWRASIGLPPRGRFANDTKLADGTTVPMLYSFSTHVVPQPADWNATTHATGYWHLPEDTRWTPSPQLEAFLKAGAAPVYVGFGSMTSANPEAKARMIIEALQKAGQRGVIATGWGGLKASDVPDSVFVLDEAPHSWLFPRMSAVVHHGGAGTTAAGLTAGKPTVICPFIADQPFWGRRVQALGVGPAPISQRKLNADNLAGAIRYAATNPDVRAKAEALGAKLRAEDGVANAIALVKRYIGEPQAVAQR